MKSVASLPLALGLVCLALAPRAEARLERESEWMLVGTGQGIRTTGRDADSLGRGSAHLTGVERFLAGANSFTVEVRGALVFNRRGFAAGALTNELVSEVLDRDGDRRLVPTELSWAWAGTANEWTLGLLDPAGFLDLNEVANDEAEQFLASPFVNNLSIDFPGYVLGAAYSRLGAGGTRYNLFLGDNRDLGRMRSRERSRLAAVPTGRRDVQGTFAAAELQRWVDATGWTLGAWRASADAEDPAAGARSGFHAVAGAGSEQRRFVVRAGAAHDAADGRTGFLALAGEWSDFGGASTAARLGIGASWLRERDAYGDAHRLLAEAYVRLELGPSLVLTPDIQFGMRHSREEGRSRLVAVGLRLVRTL